MTTEEHKVPSLDDPFLTLNEWEIFIRALKKKHGDYAILTFDAGANNIQAIVKTGDLNKIIKEKLDKER